MTTEFESSGKPQAETRRDDERASAPPLSVAASSVYLGLGSNVGDREANLREAIERIKRLGLEVVCASSIYETEPVGYADQGWFLNQVIEVKVALDVCLDAGSETEAPDILTPNSEHLPHSQLWVTDLLCALLKVEQELGRERTIANGPRVIDIDILICGEMDGVFCNTRLAKGGPKVGMAGTPNLINPHIILPHPRMHERRFVLEPLSEIAPDLMHPRLKKSCRELLAALADPSRVRLYKRGEPV
jgi:2-amino-4-hydroxy-6-hydroxymethyldihydropteridine diphosphokinase